MPILTYLTSLALRLKFRRDLWHQKIRVPGYRMALLSSSDSLLAALA